jgi:hypothetical protein
VPLDIQLAIDQLLENENLTANLDSATADWLLSWAVNSTTRLLSPLDEGDEEQGALRLQEVVGLVRWLNAQAPGAAARSPEGLAAGMEEFAARYADVFRALPAHLQVQPRSLSTHLLASAPAVRAVAGSPLDLIQRYIAYAEQRVLPPESPDAAPIEPPEIAED